MKRDNMDYGTLRVATPDGQIREHPVTVPSVVIGRADGNQVVIDHVSVSRRHALLVIESGRITIEDLGSGTGTFVGTQRIPANTPNIVESGQTMKFGEVEARFTSAEAVAPGAVAAIAVDDTDQTIGVSLLSPSQPVAAGSPTTATVNVQNRGNVVDELTIRIVDLPESWVRVSRPTLSLVPGARDEITVVIQPPKDSASAAGEYPFSVAVTSKARGREVRALGKVTILGFEGFRITLEPTRGQRDFVVSATNDGNVAMNLTLSGTDEAREFGYTFGMQQFDLAPGEVKRIPLAVRPTRQNKTGPETYRPFRIEARHTGGHAVAMADGSLILKPPMQPYKWPAIIALFVVLLAAVGLVLYLLSQNDDDEEQPDPEATQTQEEGDATAEPEETPEPGATATPPASLEVGGNGVIVNSAPIPDTSNCLAVRENPGTDGNVEGRLCTGEKVAIEGGPRNADGFKWWEIEAANGLAGWSAEASADGTTPFIVPAP